MSSGKRKRVVITIDKKLEAVRRVINGESSRTVAADLGVGVSTVSDWIKCKAKLEWHCIHKTSNRKTMKPSEYEKLNEAVFLWFSQCQRKGIKLPGTAIQEKAKLLAEMFGDDYKKFTASSGWLDRWKTNYGVRQRNNSGEKLPVDENADILFKTEFKDIVKNYSKDQIFNAGETVVNFKTLPKKSGVVKDDDSVDDYKTGENRLTVLLCSNASGTLRFPIISFSKSENSQPLRNIATNNLLPACINQLSASTSCDTFKKWFYEKFVPGVEQFLADKNLPRRAILFVDKSTHSQNLFSGDIVVTFFPPNVTSLMRPMNQNIFAIFKKNYCKVLLRFLFDAHCEEEKTVSDLLKRIDVEKVINLCDESWEKIDASTIQNSWGNLFDESSTTATSVVEDSIGSVVGLVRELPGCETIEENDVKEWLIMDHNEELVQDMTDEEIVAAVLQTDIPELSYKDVFEHFPNNTSVTLDVETLNVLESAAEGGTSHETEEAEDPINASPQKHFVSIVQPSGAVETVALNVAGVEDSPSGKRKSISHPARQNKKQKPNETNQPFAPDDAASWCFDDGFGRTSPDMNEPLVNEVYGSVKPVNETKITTENADEFTIFGHYIACKLRQLNNKRALATAQNKITNYLFQLEIGNFNADL